ncbi:MAG: YezD family protein [Clostridiaceae bacterium]|nr:YezD family protein [Clostridiaceae bacterium]
MNNKKIVVKDEEIQKIKEIISGIRFGSVTITIQDGVLIQIEKHEKIRFR